MHLADFMASCDFGRRLETLGRLTPYEYIARIRTSEPDRFIVDPIRRTPVLNNRHFPKPLAVPHSSDEMPIENVPA